MKSLPDSERALARRGYRAGGPRPSPGTNEFRDGWRILIAATLGSALGFPTLMVHTLGLFAPELAHAFGWGFSQIMGGLIVVTAIVVVSGPIIGWLSDRFGVRTIAVVSSLLLGLSFMGFAFSSGSLTQYYTTWLLLSIGGAGSAQIVWTKVINQHFNERRGLALGIVLAGVGVYAIVGKVIAGTVIAAFGWRAAYIAIGLLPILFLVPTAFWALPRKRPADCDADIVAGHPTAPRTESLTFEQALKSRHFWLLGLAFLPMSLALGGPIPNAENILHSAGLTKEAVRGLTPWLGVTMIVGRLGCGWLADLVHVPWLACVLMALNAGACLLLAQPEVSHLTALCAILLLGVAIGGEIDLASYMVARYLGVRHYGLLFGILYAAIAFGGGVGPSIYARYFDYAGSYQGILHVTAFALIAPSVLFLLLGPYPSSNQYARPRHNQSRHHDKESA